MGKLPAELANRRLYIEHLAERLQAMEQHRLPMNPLGYRLAARRLRQAIAGFPQELLAQSLAITLPAVAHALADRHFDEHGAFAGAVGKAIGAATDASLRRLAGPRTH